MSASDPHRTGDWSELYLDAKVALERFQQACQDQDRKRAHTAAGDLAIAAQRMRVAAESL